MKLPTGYECNDAFCDLRKSVERMKVKPEAEKILNLPELAPAPKGQESNVLYKKTLQERLNTKLAQDAKNKIVAKNYDLKNIFNKIQTGRSLSKTESEKYRVGDNGEPWKTNKDPYSMAKIDPLDNLFEKYDRELSEATSRKAIQENFFMLDNEAKASLKHLKEKPANKYDEDEINID